MEMSFFLLLWGGRSEPVNSFTWGADSIVSVRFNPSEHDVFATTARSTSSDFFSFCPTKVRFFSNFI